MTQKWTFSEHSYVIYRWKAFSKLISMVVIKTHKYALWAVNYAHKFCIIRPKMTPKRTFSKQRHVIYRWKAFLKLISLVVIETNHYLTIPFCTMGINHAHKLCITPKWTISEHRHAIYRWKKCIFQTYFSHGNKSL